MAEGEGYTEEMTNEGEGRGQGQVKIQPAVTGGGFTTVHSSHSTKQLYSLSECCTQQKVSCY